LLRGEHVVVTAVSGTGATALGDASTAREAVDGGDAPVTAGDEPDDVVIRRYRLTYDDGSEPEVIQAPTPSEAVRLRQHARLPSGIDWLDAMASVLRRPPRDPHPLLGRIWADRLFDEA
jgi:hypothetical protein